VYTQEALDWYEKAAAHDPPHPDALYNLGLLYYEGFHDSLEIDPARSFLLIKTAADVCNDPSALFFVGHIGLQGDEKIPKKIIPDDIKYAWNCVKSAADQGMKMRHTVAMLTCLIPAHFTSLNH